MSRNENENPSSGVWVKLFDAARVLGVSEITLRRKIKQNKIVFRSAEYKYFVFIDKNFFDANKHKIGLLPHENYHGLNEIDALQKQTQHPLENPTILLKELEEKEKLIAELQRKITDQQILISIFEGENIN